MATPTKFRSAFIKVTYRDDIKRFSLHPPFSIETLRTIVKTKFELGDTAFILTLSDKLHRKMALTASSEIEDAVKDAPDNTLRVYVETEKLSGWEGTSQFELIPIDPEPSRELLLSPSLCSLLSAPSCPSLPSLSSSTSDLFASPLSSSSDFPASPSLTKCSNDDVVIIEPTKSLTLSQSQSRPRNKFEESLFTLEELGFKDRSKNITVLVKHIGDLPLAIEELLASSAIFL